MPKIYCQNKVNFQAGQTVMEYLLLLAVMAVLALTAFHTMLPEVYIKTNGHFSNVVTNMVGDLPNPSETGPFP